MAINQETEYGKIEITREAIAALAGEAATDCYGVMGLVEPRASRAYLMEILHDEDYVKGVDARKVKDVYEVDIYLAVAYGIKITEVIQEVQKRVAYTLKKSFSLEKIKVNVYLQRVVETQ